MRTSGEEAVFGENGYCVDQQYRDCEGAHVSLCIARPSSGIRLHTIEEASEVEEEHLDCLCQMSCCDRERLEGGCAVDNNSSSPSSPRRAEAFLRSLPRDHQSCPHIACAKNYNMARQLIGMICSLFERIVQLYILIPIF